MSVAEALHRLEAVLQAENQALDEGAPETAVALIAEKQAAAAALTAALPTLAQGPPPDPALAETLRRLAAENTARLALAIEVQGRMLELVARAARQAAPPPGQYGRGGMLTTSTAAQALAMRA